MAGVGIRLRIIGRISKMRRWAPLAVLILCLPAFCESPAPAGPSPAKVPLQIIVLSSSEQAQRIFVRLKNGDDFGVLAKEKSTDPTADAGGYMGRIEPASLLPELRDALRGLAPGQISPVTHIPAGYAILKLMPESAASELENASQQGLQSLSAPGSVKFTPNVSGFPEASAAFARFPKPDGWEQDPKMACQIRKESLEAAIKGMQDHLSPANVTELAGEEPFNLLQEYYALGQLFAYRGSMDQAMELYVDAFKIAASRVPAAVPQLEEELGIAYLHRSEMANDVYRSPGERCLLPLGSGPPYAKTDDSRKAVDLLTRYLETDPDDLAAKWLLNLAYSTLGAYPAGVPAKYLIPPSVFASKEKVQRFVDVAPAAGLNFVSMAGGLIVDDFENNGRLDVVTSSMDMCQPMHYFHNNGDGTFTERSKESGLQDQLGGLNIIQTDYNNDGCTDILVLRGGWEVPMRRSLLRNNCNGTFTDVTRSSGLADPATATQTAVWADINNDGLLDLFIGSENGPSQLFLNKGNGKFEDISHSAGVDRVAFTKAVVAADYDNDGYVDFYVSNLLGDNFLYHNNHDNTFTEVAQQAGVSGSGRGFAAWFFDYDNDGWPDLFVTSYFMSVDETMRTYLGLPHNAATLKLYHNLGNGTFQDVTTEVGLDKVFMPMGANFGDIDNDGFLDIYMGNGNPNFASEVPHVLLRNHDGKYFVDVTASSGTGELHKGHGVAFADISRDGNEDILTETGGAVPSDAHAFRLFENPGNGNDWVNLKLVGVKSNRAAIGARIKVTVENEGKGTRSIYRTVGSGGSFGASPFEQHIGLGKAARILNIEIWWPASNTRQNFVAPEKDQFLEIKEFAKDYTKLDRKPVRLGGRSREAAALISRPAKAADGSK
jgi:tetratricopeptide (TPR) repeat protein